MRGQIFATVTITGTYTQIFTGELLFCTKDSILFDGENVFAWKYFLKFLPECAQFEVEVSFVMQFVPGDSLLVQGTRTDFVTQ